MTRSNPRMQALRNDITARLRLTDYKQRAEVIDAINALSALPGEFALQTLIDLCEHKDIVFRHMAQLALGLRGDVRALPVLLKAIENKDRNKARIALALLGDPRGLDQFIQINADDGYFTNHKIWGLGRFMALNEDDEETRERALYELVMVNGSRLSNLNPPIYPTSDRIVEKAIRMLDNPDSDVQLSAAVVLQYYDDERCLDILKDEFRKIVIEHPPYDSRHAVISKVLGEHVLDVLADVIALPDPPLETVLRYLIDLMKELPETLSSDTMDRLEPFADIARDRLLELHVGFAGFGYLSRIATLAYDEDQLIDDILHKILTPIIEHGSIEDIDLADIRSFLRDFDVSNHPLIHQYILPAIPAWLEEDVEVPIIRYRDGFELLGVIGTAAAAEILRPYAVRIMDAAGEQEREISKWLKAVSALANIVPDEAMAMLENFFTTYRHPQRPPLWDEVQPNINETARSIYLRLFEQTDPKAYQTFIEEAIAYCYPKSKATSPYRKQIGTVQLSLAYDQAASHLIRSGASGILLILKVLDSQPNKEKQLLKTVTYYAKGRLQADPGTYPIDELEAAQKIVYWLIKRLKDPHIPNLIKLSDPFPTRAEQAARSLRIIGTPEALAAADAFAEYYPQFLRGLRLS